MKRAYQVTCGENAYVVIATAKRKARKEVAQTLTGILEEGAKRPKVKVKKLKSKKALIVCMGPRGIAYPMISMPELPLNVAGPIPKAID